MAIVLNFQRKELEMSRSSLSDLITLGEFLEFLEWKKQKERPKLLPAPISPVIFRLYRENGRLYFVTRNNQLHRLTLGKNALSWLAKMGVKVSLAHTSSHFDIFVTSGRLMIGVVVPEGKVVSVLQDGRTFIRTASREGEKITL